MCFTSWCQGPRGYVCTRMACMCIIVIYFILHLVLYVIVWREFGSWKLMFIYVAQTCSSLITRVCVVELSFSFIGQFYFFLILSLYSHVIFINVILVEINCIIHCICTYIPLKCIIHGICTDIPLQWRRSKKNYWAN